MNKPAEYRRLDTDGTPSHVGYYPFRSHFCKRTDLLFSIDLSTVLTVAANEMPGAIYSVVFEHLQTL